jgi:hypothetical protein
MTSEKKCATDLPNKSVRLTIVIIAIRGWNRLAISAVPGSQPLKVARQLPE